MNAIGMVTLTGVAAGLGVVLAMLLYLVARRRPLWAVRTRNEADRKAIRSMSLGSAVSPWLVLTGFAVIVNAPFLPFFDLTFSQWKSIMKAICCARTAKAVSMNIKVEATSRSIVHPAKKGPCRMSPKGKGQPSAEPQGL